MLLALDTPKLWDRLSLGLESTGLGRLYKQKWGKDTLESFNLHLPQFLCHINAVLHCIYLLLASESSLSKIFRRA